MEYVRERVFQFQHELRRKCFNSKLVRLKVKAFSKRVEDLDAGFNSKLVRLKVYADKSIDDCKSYVSIPNWFD